MVELEGDELLNFLLSQPPAEELQEVNSFSLGNHQQTELRLEEELYWYSDNDINTQTDILLDI